MTEQKAVRYTRKGVYLIARKTDAGSLLIALDGEEPSYKNQAVEIRPKPDSVNQTHPPTKWWFTLHEFPSGRGGPGFGNADTLDKAVAEAEKRLLGAARRRAEAEVMAHMAFRSVAEAGEGLDRAIDQWLEGKRSEATGA